LCLSEGDAAELCAALLSASTAPLFSDVQRSALSEAANIVASACLNAIGRLTGLTLLPSTPHLAHGAASAAVQDALSPSESATGLLVALQSRFRGGESPPIEGQLVVVPDRQGLRTLLAKLGV